MFNKNYTHWQCLLATGTKASPMFTNLAGATKGYVDSSLENAGFGKSGFGGYANTSYKTSLIVGTGTTEANINDYCLASMITADKITVNSVTASSNDTTVTIVASMTYTGTENVEITEVGLVKSFQVQTSGSTLDQIMLSREVISPVKVSSGQTFLITMEFDYKR